MALVELAKYRPQFTQRYWPAEQITLEEIAALLGEELVLLEGFDAFGDHLQVQGVSHDDDCLDDFHVLSATRYILNERTIDLQGVQRQALEVGQ
ncbi:hypothetical protein D3C84_1081870 [compost metagenome]